MNVFRILAAIMFVVAGLAWLGVIRTSGPAFVSFGVALYLLEGVSLP